MAGGAEEHELTAAEFFDREDGDPAGEEVFGAVGGGEDAGGGGGEVDAVLVDGGGVVGDEVDAADLMVGLACTEIYANGRRKSLPQTLGFRDSKR